MDYLIPSIVCALCMLFGVWLGKQSADKRREYLNNDAVKIDDNGEEALLLVEPMRHKGEIKKIILIEHRERDELKTFIEEWRI